MARPSTDSVRDAQAFFVLLHSQMSLQPCFFVRMLHVYQSVGFFAPFRDAEVELLLSGCAGLTIMKFHGDMPPLKDFHSYAFAVTEALS